MMTEEVVQIRRDCRIETLRDLASLVASGIELTEAALLELVAECETATMPFVSNRLRLKYAWNFYYTDGRQTTGENAGRLRGPVWFTLTTGHRDYWCSNCGARLSLHTTHWKDDNGSVRLCNKCAGGE